MPKKWVTSIYAEIPIVTGLDCDTRFRVEKFFESFFVSHQSTISQFRSLILFEQGRLFITPQGVS